MDRGSLLKKINNEAPERKKKDTKNDYKISHEYDRLVCNPRLGHYSKIKTAFKFSPKAHLKKTERSHESDNENCIQIQGSRRTLFRRRHSEKPTPSYTTVFLHLEEVCDRKSSKKVTFQENKNDYEVSENVSKKEMIIRLPVKGSKMISKGVQTDYRESEAQTLPWKHDIQVDRRFLNELLALEPFCLATEWSFLPGLEEVSLIERAREKLAWENVVGRLWGRENDSMRKVLVARIAEAETATREKTAAQINEERMNMSKKLIMREKERWQDELRTRLLNLYGTRRTENDKKIRRWSHQHSRKIRKMKKRRLQSCTASDVHAGQFTKNEKIFSRGHTFIDFHLKYLKKYDGLSTLEKHLFDFQHQKACRFDYEEASKPRQVGLCPKRQRQMKSRGWMKRNSETANDSRKESFLRVPVQVLNSEPSTPKIDRAESEIEEELNQVSILLVKIVKGRAVQTKNFLQFSKMAADSGR